MNHIHSVVVGGSKGLGKAITKKLIDEGHLVSILARKGAMEEFSASHCQLVRGDLAHPGQIKAAILKMTRRFGPLHNIVFAQRYRGKKNGWTGELETTLTGTKNFIEFASRSFARNKHISITVIGSVAGHYIVDDQPIEYHVSKAALEQLVRFYAVALGPRNVCVNGIAPSAFVKDVSRQYYLGDKNRRQFFEKLNPLGRMLSAEDIAHVVSFFCSPETFITGQIITMDAGASLLWPDASVRRVSK